MTLKNDEKYEVELTCRFKIDTRNLTNFDSWGIWQNFHQSTWKSPNWDLDSILLSKIENVWA